MRRIQFLVFAVAVSGVPTLLTAQGRGAYGRGGMPREQGNRTRRENPLPLLLARFVFSIGLPFGDDVGTGFADGYEERGRAALGDGLR